MARSSLLQRNPYVLPQRFSFKRSHHSLTHFLSHSRRKRTQKQLVIISSAIYIYKTIKIITFQTFFLCFFTSSNDIPTNSELHFLISKTTVTSGFNDSNVLSESDPKYRSKKLRLIYLLTYKKNATHIYISYRVKSRNAFILKP